MTTVPVDPVVSALALKLVGSAISKVVLTSVGLALAEFQEKKAERAVNALIAALAELEALTPEAAGVKLDALLTTAVEGVRDPHEVVYETFRHFAFTRAEAAWPYIATMTAEYLAAKRPVDKFFRRMGWLLERCEAEDIEVLRAAARATAEELSKPRDFTHRLVTWNCLAASAAIEVEVVDAEKGVLSSLMGDGGIGDGTADGVRALLAESRLARPRGARKVAFLVGGDDRIIERIVTLLRT